MSSTETPNLAESLSSLARTLHLEGSPLHTLEAISKAAVETVPGAEHAGMTMVRNRPGVVHGRRHVGARGGDRSAAVQHKGGALPRRALGRPRHPHGRPGGGAAVAGVHA